MTKNKVKLVIAGLSVVAGIVILQACKKTFLDAQPYGLYTTDLLKSKKGVEGLLVGVYGVLDGQNISGDGWEGSAVNWATAGVAADDDYKGTDANDQPQMTEVEQYQSQPTNRYFYNKWLVLYEGVARANDVIRLANDPDLTGATDDDKRIIIAQARMLRGHFHFDAKRLWNNIPFIDENTTTYDNATSVWPQIEADFQFAYDNLPEVMSQKGMVNKWAAAASLARVYMFQKKFTEAKALYDLITTVGTNSQGVKYALQPTYQQNFDPNFDNSSEAVFTVSAAASGSVDQSAETSLGLAFPYGGDFGCCGFFQPSVNLVNAYKTGADGLPLFTTFNATDLKNDQGLKDADPYMNDVTQPLDPRLDWAVGRRGIPFYDWGPHPGYSWVRDQNYAGPFSPKKHIYTKAMVNVLTSSGWRNITSKDIYLIRYADVLLMAAEAEIEVGTLPQALIYTNLVRARAANPDGRVMGRITGFVGGDNTKPIIDDAQPAGNYVINPYPSFPDADYARTAVRFERRLELSHEGHRFFDLVRWGIAAETLNAYLAVEKTKRTYKQTATFTAGRNEYFPIPASIIDVAAKYGNTLTQNPGY
jgi:hypothetical protein